MSETRKILSLAWPLIIGQLGQMMLGVADTVMVGALGVIELAALTFASLIFYVPFLFGMGALTAVSIRTSAARGRGDAETARSVCRNGFYLGTGIGVGLFLLSLGLLPLLDRFGQEPEVAERATGYFVLIMASGIPALMGIALKNHADAMDHPWPAFWISFSGIILNIGLNWVMIFGKLGCPALGLEGAGWATLISRILILLATVAWFLRSKKLDQWVPVYWFRNPDYHELRRLFVLGWPGALQTLAEVGAFSCAGVLIGRYGAESLAAHQIALTCAATAFMVPLGLSMALTVRVGETHGSMDRGRMRRIAKSGWLLSLGFSGFSAMIFLTFGETLASWFIEKDEVIAMATGLLAIAGVFQIVDGLQVASGGMLRGMQDVRVPAGLGIASYWLAAIPLALFFGDGLGFEEKGVWWGLATGLGVAAVVLGRRLLGKLREQVMVE